MPKFDEMQNQNNTPNKVSVKKVVDKEMHDKEEVFNNVLDDKVLENLHSLTKEEVEFLKGKIFATNPEALQAGISLLKSIIQLMETTEKQKKEIEENFIQPISIAFNQLMDSDNFFTDFLCTLSAEKGLQGLSLKEIAKSELYQKSLDNAIKKAFRDKALQIDNIANAFEILKSNLPKNYFIANNKLSNEITKDFLNKGQIELAVINPRKKNEVCTYNSLSYDTNGITIVGEQEFTAYDRSIHNAVCTLYEAGNECITPQMVYRTMNGMTNSEYVSMQTITDIIKSIDKSRFMRLKVDFTEEARVRGLDIKRAVIDGYLLAAESVILSTGGQEVVGYRILKKPLLYQYAQQTKQIISVPLTILDTREVINNTMEIIPIKEYLVRRIEVMRHEKGANKITYETVFFESGIMNPTKQKAHKLRKIIKSILLLWKSKKYIKDFLEYKSGKNLKGIEIYF